MTLKVRFKVPSSRLTIQNPTFALKGSQIGERCDC